jgi:2-methylcitrate dehydratase PrpD
VRLTPVQIADVEVAVNPVVPDVLRHPRPTNGLERKFSMEYCAAAALADGRVDLASFVEGDVPEATRGLMTRVRMVVVDDLPKALEQNAWSRVTVRLGDGRTLTMPPRGALGHPDTPLTDARLREKFLGCAARALPADDAGAVAEQIARLDDVPDIRALTSRLAANTI